MKDELRYETSQASRGQEMGRGIPLSNRLGCLGERRELPRGVRGKAPAENDLAHFNHHRSLLVELHRCSKKKGGHFSAVFSAV